MGGCVCVSLMFNNGSQGREMSVAGGRACKLTWRISDVIDVGEDGERDRTQQADDPQAGDDAHRPLQPRHGVQVQRVADGKKALHREGDDGQHRDVGGSFRDECANFAEGQTEIVRILVPVEADLVREPCMGENGMELNG